MAGQRASLGRSVWFRASDGTDKVAFITAVGEEEQVTLSVLGRDDEDAAVLRIKDVPRHNVQAPENSFGVPSPSWRFPRIVG